MLVALILSAIAVPDFASEFSNVWVNTRGPEVIVVGKKRIVFEYGGFVALTEEMKKVPEGSYYAKWTTDTVSPIFVYPTQSHSKAVTATAVAFGEAWLVGAGTNKVKFQYSRSTGNTQHEATYSAVGPISDIDCSGHFKGDQIEINISDDAGTISGDATIYEKKYSLKGTGSGPIRMIQVVTTNRGEIVGALDLCWAPTKNALQKGVGVSDRLLVGVSGLNLKKYATIWKTLIAKS